MAARRSRKSTWKEEGITGGVWRRRKYWQPEVTWQALHRTDRISLKKYPLFLLLRIDFSNKIALIRSRLETEFVFKRHTKYFLAQNMALPLLSVGSHRRFHGNSDSVN
jgi:hypothetical protein